MGQAMSAGDQLCLDEGQQSSQHVLLQMGLEEPGQNRFLRQKGTRFAPVSRQRNVGEGSVWPPRK